MHAHAALFGAYGMLGIGLMLFCLHTLRPGLAWKEGLLRFGFWPINGGRRRPDTRSIQVLAPLEQP